MVIAAVVVRKRTRCFLSVILSEKEKERIINVLVRFLVDYKSILDGFLTCLPDLVSALDVLGDSAGMLNRTCFLEFSWCSVVSGT